MKLNLFAVCLVAGLALPLTPSAAPTDGEAAVPAANLDAAPPADASAAATAEDALAKVIDDYRIGPSDLLEVSVYQVPELSRTVRVNGRGELTLPLIGQVHAGGLTGQQLEERIARKLKETYLQDPQVSVFIKEFVSQRVTVSGDVMRPGVFPISGRTTLMQAVAMAGGFGKLANEGDIKVIRTSENGTREVLEYDHAPIRKGERVDPPLYAGDVVVVGKSKGRAALKGVTETLRDVSIFGLFF